MLFRALLAASLLANVAAAQTTPSERVDVNLVLIDATVTDRDGNPILGLGPDDFIVSENGAQQTIESVDFFTSRRMLDRPEAKAKFDVDRVREERNLIFFFDKPDDYGTAEISDMQAARSAAREFVNKQMVDTDRVAIAGHDVRLKIYTDFTSDKKQVLRGIDEAIGFGRGLTSGSGDILSNVDKDRMIKKTGRVYEALEILADATRTVRGRKTLILFTYGMGDVSTRSASVIDRGDEQYVASSIAALNRANVSVHPLNLFRDANFRPTEEYLSRYAEETNGIYQRTLHRFEPGIRRINKENAGYYLIAYRPTSRGEGFQKVDVKLRNSEFRISARRGYTR